ncbi:MAG: class I SAM-dependent methyltransferase [Myxococcota bacterium]
MMSTDKSTTDFWNALAEGYAKKPVENPEAFEQKIEHTKACMNPDSIVLDIGCGTGSLALRLASSGAHVHGLDFSSQMIRIAEDKTSRQGVDNVSFHVGAFDERFKAFEPESLDVVCAYSLIHLVKDRPAALRQIYRLLKPGGFFVSSTLCLDESWKPYRALLRVMRWLGKAPHVGIFTKATLKREFDEAGFVELRMPDVGAEKIVAFVLCRKPSRSHGRQ